MLIDDQDFSMMERDHSAVDGEEETSDVDYDEPASVRVIH